MTQDTEDVVALLAAEIMAAMRRAKFPKDHVAEAHDEFEALTLVPMIRETFKADRQSLSDRIDVLKGALVEVLDGAEQEYVLGRFQANNQLSAIAKIASATLHQEGISAKPLTNET